MRNRLHYLLYRAFFGQRAILAPVREELGLGPGQPKILLYLLSEGPSPQRSIASFYSVDPASVSRMAEQLKRNGFVELKQSTTDRRVNLLFLTEKGLDAARRWDKAGEKAEGMLMRGFSKEEEEILLSLLGKMIENGEFGSDE